MNLIAALIKHALDAIDLLFDALAALYRVLMRAAFSPDARSYRGARFATLSADDVFVQEISLNVADQAEAKKAVALDPESILPLAAETVAFDIVGPLESHGKPRARPERSFLLGVVRKDALNKARAEAPALRRGAMEAFVFRPPTHAQYIFLFGDTAGDKRRRLRRVLTAAAALVCAFAFTDALERTRSALGAAAETADAERLEAERRIRLAERRVRTAEAALAATTRARVTPIGDVARDVVRIAQQQPAETETTSLEFADGEWRLAGQSYNADIAELQLRRAFEHQVIAFVAEPGQALSPFTVRIEDAGTRP